MDRARLGKEGFNGVRIVALELLILTIGVENQG
jgi:hypothetical protein